MDVWWGDVEKAGDNRFDWSYYDRVFREITAAGLEIAPIFSFHQCGGNVGDDYTSLLPSWLWRKYAGRTVGGLRVGVLGLQHRSEQGHFSRETVQGRANVSLGPSGELRCPSYNSHDTGTGYPTRGALQVVDVRRRTDPLDPGVRRVPGAVDAAQGVVAVQRPPLQVAHGERGVGLFTSGAYRDTAYGRTSSTGTTARWSTTADGCSPRSPRRCAATSRRPTSATRCPASTGRWDSSPSPGHRPTPDPDQRGHLRLVDRPGYARIVRLGARPIAGRPVVMHLTALEMGDGDTAPAYSLAKTLVGWIGDYAHRVGTDLKGDNALSGGVQSDLGWDQIEDAFAHWGYLGLTVLRMSDVAEGTGATRYAGFIATYR